MKKKTLGSYPIMSVVFSVTLAVFAMGVMGLLYLFAKIQTDYIKDTISIQVFLKDNLSDSTKANLNIFLQSQKYVAFTKEGTKKITFESKDDAAKKMIQETGEDFVSFLGSNPLKDVYIVNINEIYCSTTNMDKIKYDLQKLPGVFEVNVKQNLVDSIINNIKRINTILVIIVSVLLIVGVLLINNTIKIALFSQRFLIRSMQLVGATKWFIIKPFLYKSALYGLCSSIIAISFLLFIINYINSKFTLLDIRLNLTNHLLDIGLLFVTLLFIGVIICVGSTLISLTRYTKMSLDDLN